MSTVIKLFLPSVFAFILFSTDAFLVKKNSVKDVLKKLTLVEGGAFTMGVTTNFKPTSDDEYLLHSSVPRRMDINSFYISSTEVTNEEWRQFYRSKVEELGSYEAFKRFRCDTSRWNEEFNFSYNATFTENYHRSEEYDDFPVVGISWEMAQEYCSWLSGKLCEELKVPIGSIKFRIPTESEWEYAASGIYQERNVDKYAIVERRFFPWRINSYRECNSFLANFGPIRDVSGFWVKQYPEDGAFYTSQVGDYMPNDIGLYDMAGNVAEWTSDKGNMYVPSSFESQESENGSVISDLIEIETAIKELRKNTNFDSLDPNVKKYFDSIVRDQGVLARGDTRIVKGGSWADGIVYMQLGTKQAIDKDHASCTIGFRIAVDYSDVLKKNIPKKLWKPDK